MRAFFRLISRLGVTGKLAAIYLLDLMVTASIVVSFVANMTDQIDFSQKELEGTAIFAPTRELYDALIHDVRATPGTGSEKVLAAKFAATDASRQAHGGDMSLDDDWAGLASAAADYDKARPGVARETAFHEYQDKLQTFLASVGDRSNLILDPDLDSYYAMAIIVEHMRAMVKEIAEFSAVALDGPATEAKTIKLSALQAELDRTLGEIHHAVDAGSAGNVDGKFLPNISPALHRFDDSITALTAAAHDGGDVRTATDTAFDATFAFWGSTTTELNRLLHIRIQGFYHQTLQKLGLTLVLALLVLCAVTYIGLQIARPVRELVSVAASFSSGDPRRAVWDSADEFGSLVTAFNNMLDRLAEEGQRREEMAAAARASEAQRDLLEAIALPVVVTSLDGARLLHANPAAQALLGDALEPGPQGLRFLFGTPEAAGIIRRLNAAGALDEVELEIIGALGVAGWMVVSARRVDYHGQEVALFSLTPVNELKRTQAELRDAKEAAEIAAEQLRATTDTLMASIRYASRIQNSIFPDTNMVQQLTHGVDIWVEQRDIVGGDWHWVGRFDDGDLVFLCDCTGHGVPGALMTMLVSACFRRVLAEEGHTAPGRILEALHAHVRSALARESGELAVDDGLDAACVFLEHGSGAVRFASARLLLLIAGEDGVQEIKGDRTSIGYPSLPESVSVIEQIVPIRPGQLLYLFTDGFTDQVGGDKRMLFGRRRLVQTIDTLRRLPPTVQIERLREQLADYRRDEPMRDDASLIVLRVAEQVSPQVMAPDEAAA